MSAAFKRINQYEDVETGQKFSVQMSGSTFVDLIAIENDDCLMCVGLPRGSQACSRLPACSRMSFISPETYALLRLQGKA